MVQDSSKDTLPKLKIGVVMPIAEIEGLSEHHWQDVLNIIKASIGTIKDYNIEFGLVSESSETNCTRVI